MDNLPTRTRPKGLTVAKAGVKVDKADRKLIGDLFFILAILAFTIVAYVRLDNNPSVLFACGLALTFFVAAEIVLTH